MGLYLRAVSDSLNLSDGKQVSLSSHKEDSMVQCFHHHRRGNNKLLHRSMAWLDSKPLGQRSCTVSNNPLPALPWLTFPVERVNPIAPAAAMLRSQHHWY